MRSLWLLPILLFLASGCRTTAPAGAGSIPVAPDAAVPPAGSSVLVTPAAPPLGPMPSAVAPEADFLYEEREGDLRDRFLDGLRSLHGAGVRPEEVRTVRGDDVADWLDALAEHNPAAAQVAFDVLEEVLDQRFVTGFIARDPAPAECAQTDEVLYIAVPSRFQIAGRAIDGLIVRDACEIGFNEMCLTCQSGASMLGPTGATCSCTCAIASCPTVECDACGE